MAGLTENIFASEQSQAKNVYHLLKMFPRCFIVLNTKDIANVTLLLGAFAFYVALWPQIQNLRGVGLKQWGLSQ